MAILEFPNRDDSPLFHCEHFIEGEYVKYNSNSGYVKEDKDHFRLTPHAFSHFTFERCVGLLKNFTIISILPAEQIWS
jgi:elongation factor 2 kinase